MAALADIPLDCRALPWESSPYHFTNWWDMLRFAAEKFYKLSEELARVGQPNTADIPFLLGGAGTPVGEIGTLTLELGLASAHDQFKRIAESVENHTVKSSAQLDALFADLHRRVHDDLKRKLIYCVESERTKYCGAEWLADSQIADKFPTALKELQAAGRCYAFGESNASAYHAMRALEVALGALAARFGVDFNHKNWHPAIEEIEAKIREMSKAPKTQQRLDDEKFYGGLGRHFMFLKNGWRNHVMHVRDNYSDREAHQMLEHVSDLMGEMSRQLAEPKAGQMTASI